MKLRYPPGATPLSADDLDGLIPGHITTQGELDAWEQQNILEARTRLARRRPKELLTDDAIRRIHRFMFGQTWQWAGHYRHSDTNIGVGWEHIPERVRILCDDARYQRDHRVYSAVEFGARFHHRLVAIHPFPNGNGRHARLVTDLLMESMGEPPFSWGSAGLNAAGAARDAYLRALRAADTGEYELLFRFVQS